MGSDLIKAGWLNPDGTQAMYSPEELELLRAQKREGNRLAKEALDSRRTLRPPRAHDWQEYMDDEVRCSACGMRRGRGWQTSAPCEGAGKVTVDG